LADSTRAAFWAPAQELLSPEEQTAGLEGKVVGGAGQELGTSLTLRTPGGLLLHRVQRCCRCKLFLFFSPGWEGRAAQRAGLVGVWKVFEAPGVEPVFLKKDQAINYAQNRASFRSGEIRILDSSGNVERIIPFNETNRKL